MGSLPCNALCCNQNIVASKPKSDLFVPQINIDSIKANKNIERNFVTSIKEKSPNKKKGVNNIFTTEQLIQDKGKFKSNLTEDGNIGRNINISFTYKNNTFIINEIKEMKKIKSSKKEILKISLTNYSMYKNMLKSNIKESIKKEEEGNQQEDLKFEISEHLLSKNEEINISNIFLYHYLFHKTNESNLIFIMKQLKEIQIEENSLVFNEGDPGSCIFLIKSGTILLS